MSPERRQFDIDALKATTDLVELASNYTSLRQVSRRGEYAGPCPVCGGEDRFHVRADSQRFYCRQCRPRGGDVIDLTQMLYDVDFVDACRLLSDMPSASSPVGLSSSASLQTVEQPAADWETVQYQESARNTMQATRRLLHSRHGGVGQEYLSYRGLEQETWHTYGLGYGQAYHPMRHKRLDAIFIPWYAENHKTITAIQHRFIDPHLAKSDRYSHKPGSQPQLFGLQAIGRKSTGHGIGPRTLFVVEGEFNCMSLHQNGVEALSVGSEANAGKRQVSASLLHVAGDYDRLVVWFDQLPLAEKLADRLHTTGPFSKKKLLVHSFPQDANELLASAELTAHLEMLLRNRR